MACTSPLTGYRAPGGKIVLQRQAAWGDLPTIPIQCGQCMSCRIERCRQWKVRVSCESQMHEKNCFITLTYDQDNLPEDHSLNVRHWQLFAKRLRKATGPFRFYHVGEYGDNTRRPHYHAILFGLNFSADRELHSIKDELRYFTSDTLTKAWALGHCLITDFSEQTAGYVTGYILKKDTGERGKSTYSTVDPDTGECSPIKPPYSTMSRRPGIGRTWLDKFHTDVYPHDFLVLNGKKHSPPKYYDAQLGEHALLALKANRVAKAKPHLWNNTPERHAVRDKLKQIRVAQRAREPNNLSL